MVITAERLPMCPVGCPKQLKRCNKSPDVLACCSCGGIFDWWIGSIECIRCEQSTMITEGDLEVDTTSAEVLFFARCGTCARLIRVAGVSERVQKDLIS